MPDPTPPEVVSASQEEERPSFPVVGIGASAGGLAAFTRLLSHLPEQTGMAFVLIQHLDPAHESQLTALLSSATHLPVTEVADGMAVEPDHVYIIPPNVSMIIKEGVLQLTPRGEAYVPHLPVDIFFCSLAEERQSRAIGVVLSGTGSDGAQGLAEIKAAAGITFAQDDDSAEYASMPQSAVASGCVDFVLPPEQIARELAQIGHHPYLRATPTSQNEPAAEGEFEKILVRLRAATGVDFGEYRQTTLRRRIARRMALHKQESLSDYLRLLQSNPTEIEALYRDMLINVTSFFRDPDVFEALKTTVFPAIIKGKSPDKPVRIWVPGCSTGQEAYSLAMVLLEFLDDKALPPAIQIFGTDINDAAAVEKARPGVYPPSIEAEVSSGRLQRFFSKVEGGYRISKRIRDLCVFARQDVAADPPFSRLDLISCRNLLIYLSPSLQQRIIPTFHYALNRGGFLLLGPSETVGKSPDLFERVDRANNIYARTAVTARPIPFRGGGSYPPPARGATPAERPPAWVDMRKDADRVLLDRFAPAAVLIDENLEILQFRGPTASYLQPPSGQATHNILKMARDSLFMELRAVIDEARKLNATARRENVRVQEVQEVQEAGAARLVNLEAIPIRRGGSAQRCFLVLFTEAPAAAAPVPAPTGDAALPPGAPETPPEGRDNAQLRQELASVKEYLQAIIEQQNAANEELQSANEEIRSANEELQTNNEEMQTAREELQSTNEELRTVNDELQARNHQTTLLGNDLTNTLYSIDLPIVILGRDLRIRRFTAAAGTLLNLIPTDVGRPFVDIKSPFDIPDSEAMLLEVITKVAVREQEAQDRTGRWYSLAVHPYRTEDHRIDGVVLVLRDIDQPKRAEEARAANLDAMKRLQQIGARFVKAGELADVLGDVVEAAIAITHADMGNIQLVEEQSGCLRIAAHRGFKQSYLDFWNSVAEGQGTCGTAMRDAQRTTVEDVAQSPIFVGTPGLEVQRAAGVRAVQSTPLFGRSGDLIGMLSTHWHAPHRAEEGELQLLDLLAQQAADTIEFSQNEQTLRQSEERFRVTQELSPDGFTILRPVRDAEGHVADFTFVYQNATIARIAGTDPQAVVGRRLLELFPGHAGTQFLKAYQHVAETGESCVFEDEYGGETTVRPTWFRIAVVPIGADIAVLAQDITERKLTEEELHAAKFSAEQASCAKDHFLAVLSHELRTPLTPVLATVAMLQQTACVDADTREQLEVIRRNAEMEARLIDDLLDVTRITRGKVELDKRPVELGTILRHAVEVCRPDIEARKVAFALDIKDGPYVVEADAGRLQQVFWNLLRNAIKFTPHGGCVGMRCGANGPGQVMVEVSDSGVGIRPDVIGSLFNAFEQGGADTTRQFGGLGLGLAISKGLVEMHGGSIEAHSDGEGKGATFRVRLPLHQVDATGRREDGKDGAAASGEAATPVNPMRILLVEDHGDTAKIMKRLLVGEGHEVQVAGDVATALELAGSQAFDLLISDLGLPDGSGVDLMRELRQRGSDVPGVALSGFGQEEDILRTKEAGFAIHLTKPTSPARLAEAIAVITKTTSNPPPPQRKKAISLSRDAPARYSAITPILSRTYRRIPFLLSTFYFLLSNNLHHLSTSCPIFRPSAKPHLPQLPVPSQLTNHPLRAPQCHSVLQKSANFPHPRNIRPFHSFPTLTAPYYGGTCFSRPTLAQI